MRLSFDPAKSARNAQERGMPFELAVDFDWSTALIVEGTREDYQERRFQALSYLAQHVCMLVFPPRADAVHVISLRRANQRERKRYAAQTKP